MGKWRRQPQKDNQRSRPDFFFLLLLLLLLLLLRDGRIPLRFEIVKIKKKKLKKTPKKGTVYFFLLSFFLSFVDDEKKKQKTKKKNKNEIRGVEARVSAATETRNQVFFF